MIQVRAVGVVAIGMLLLSCAAVADNAVVDFLVEHGVPVTHNDAVKLAAPTLADGLNAADQRKQMERLMERKYSWEEFTRRTVVAPFVLRISGDKNGESRLGRSVDLWFVAYGDLNVLKSDDFITDKLKLFGTESDRAQGSFVRLLTDTELAGRGIAAPQRIDDPRIIISDVIILDRVRLRATMRTLKTSTNDSVLVAAILDERFSKDNEFPIVWNPLTNDVSGRRQIGAAQSYSGMGLYLKATRLIEPQGAMFIEFHAVFAEPQGWFDGTNLLRSKLPVIAQDAVRKARRSLTTP